ncbi:MAG: LpqB family beta-propeller domain-containing protein, partial [Nocardioidaceae bacterium]
MILGTILCVAVSGCVQLPTSSPVHPGRTVGMQDQPPVVNNFHPEGPQVDETPANIVKGYLLAMTAYPPAPDLVREFMTPQAAAHWDPKAGLTVYTDQSIAPRDQAVTFSARKLGSLDHRGSWHSATASERRLDEMIKVRKVHGQWRISNPPAGTLVDLGYFTHHYRSYSLYFFNADRSALVADPVYLLYGGSTATALVRDELLGPTRDIADVASTIPIKTSALGVAVSVSASGVAEVPLNDSVLSLSPEDKRLLAAQLAWTLRQQFLGISKITITVDGTAVDIPGVDDAFGVDQFEGYDPAAFAASGELYALSKGHLVTASLEDITEVTGPIGGSKLQARSAAVDPPGDLAALVGDQGHTVQVGSVKEEPRLVRRSNWFTGGVNLLSPSWDVHKVLWLVDRTADGAVVYTVTADGHDVAEAPGISGKDVRAFAVSRDGVRFAAIVGSGSSSSLVVATIQRKTGHPAQARLTGVHHVLNAEHDLTHLTGLAWSSPTDVVVLAKEH